MFYVGTQGKEKIRMVKTRPQKIFPRQVRKIFFLEIGKIYAVVSGQKFGPVSREYFMLLKIDRFAGVYYLSGVFLEDVNTRQNKAKWQVVIPNRLRTFASWELCLEPDKNGFWSEDQFLLRTRRKGIMIDDASAVCRYYGGIVSCLSKIV